MEGKGVEAERRGGKRVGRVGFIGGKYGRALKQTETRELRDAVG